MTDTDYKSPRHLLSLPQVPTRQEQAEQLRAAPPARPTPSYVPHRNRTRPRQALTPEQQALEEKVIAALRAVYDPEIPVNIYELGLVYDIEILPENRVHVRMTLTAPACPVAGTLPPEVEARIENVDEVKAAAVEIIWDPQWTKEMMSEEARLELNFL